NNFPLPDFPALGILDSQSEEYQALTIIRANFEILRGLAPLEDVYLVDYFRLMARVGSSQGIDERQWQASRAPISRQALIPLGLEYCKFIRALRGKARKCLVLDCDNTLWGGVVGEDGADGLKLGTSHPGSSYLAFQQYVLELHDRGVVLALCSKNNEADVLQVLRQHPEMALREQHFATWQINWQDKAA